MHGQRVYIHVLVPDTPLFGMQRMDTGMHAAKGNGSFYGMAQALSEWAFESLTWRLCGSGFWNDWNDEWD